MQLLCDIKLLEVRLQCSVMVYHVPGKTMIVQGTDGLSRGVILHQHSGVKGVTMLRHLFRPAIPFSVLLYFCFDFAHVDPHLRNFLGNFGTTLIVGIDQVLLIVLFSGLCHHSLQSSAC